jgi:RNA polymerase sigma factor (TIGR02999 family)
MNQITQYLEAIDRGEPRAAENLLPLVYEELRKLAADRLAREKPGQTLQPTALVHEAYLRLVGPHKEDRGWDHRGHFFAAAAEAMRRILVEAARRKQRARHGGGHPRVALDTETLAAPEIQVRDDLVALDAALTRLAEHDAQAARLVELRHFAGLTVAQAAEILDISPRSADRVWTYARAWLHRELAGTPADPRE